MAGISKTLSKYITKVKTNTQTVEQYLADNYPANNWAANRQTRKIPSMIFNREGKRVFKIVGKFTVSNLINWSQPFVAQVIFELVCILFLQVFHSNASF